MKTYEREDRDHDAIAGALRYFAGGILNGFGELSDLSFARGQLRDASRAILEALSAFDRAEKAGWTQHGD